MTAPAGSRRLRLALVCDWYLPRVGGIERHLGQLGGHLVAAGHEVTVITPTRGTSGISSEGVHVHRLAVRLLPVIGLMWTPAGFRQLGAVLRAGRFDVVHIHSSVISPAAYAALYHAQAAGLPAAITVHSIWSGYRRLFAWLDRLAGWTRWPVAFSAVSTRAARDMQPLLGSTPIDIAPSAIDPEDWRPSPNPPADRFALACVMRLAPRKRGAALLAIIRTVRAQLPAGIRLQLEIAGDGPERRKLARLARRLGVDDCVTFLGSLDTAGVKALLNRSHACVLPTEVESFGIAALEARAAGLPVVVMRCGAVGEWLADGREGLLADNDAEFARHIVQLATDRSRWEQIARHNRETPVELTWERSIQAHERLYARAIELRSGSR